MVILSFEASCLALPGLDVTLQFILTLGLKLLFLMHQTTLYVFVFQNLFGQCLVTTWK